MRKYVIRESKISTSFSGINRFVYFGVFLHTLCLDVAAVSLGENYE